MYQYSSCQKISWHFHPGLALSVEEKDRLDPPRSLNLRRKPKTIEVQNSEDGPTLSVLQQNSGGIDQHKEPDKQLRELEKRHRTSAGQPPEDYCASDLFREGVNARYGNQERSRKSMRGHSIFIP